MIDFAPRLSVIYSYTMLILQILVLGAAAGVVLSLFKSPLQIFRAYCLIGREIYIFTEFNKKTCGIAESIKEKKKAKILFTDCDNLKSGDIDKITQLSGIFLRERLTSVCEKIIKIYRNRRIYLFLFSESESENISKLNELSKTPTVLNPKANVKVFIELLETGWDEQNAINENDTNIIKALIIGGDDYSFAMIRHILALGQMPKYFVQVYVIDKNRGFDILKSSFRNYAST